MVHVTYLELLGIILLGIIIFQLAVLIVAQFASDEDVVIGFSIFFWMPFVMVMRAIVPKIRLLISQKKYNYYQLYGDCIAQSDGAVKPRWILNLCMTPKMAKKFKQVGRDEPPVEYSIKLLREGRELKSSPHKVEILKEKHLQEGMPAQGLTKEFLGKFLK